MRSKQRTTVITILALIALVQMPAVAASGSAAGRRHATKADMLAAKNRCKAAVPEFTKAYRLLKDPMLLFKRGECYRDLGKDKKALKDYEDFLSEMPDAPNRKTVEERIAALHGGHPAGPASDDGMHSGRREDSNVSASAIGTAAPVAPEPRPAADLTTQPAVAVPQETGTHRTWLWIGTAVVVAGAGAFAAYHYWPRPKTDAPQTPLGNYPF